MLCGEKSLVNEGPPGDAAISLPCRAWTCEHCRPRRKRELTLLAAAGRPERFITLTMPPGLYGSVEQAAWELAHAWRVVAKRIRRAWPEARLEYFAVFEATEQGTPHLHLLQRGPYIPQRWLSQQMAELIGAPIVDIRKVRDVRHAVWYVTKYVGKAPQRFGKLKRYWHTPGWVVDDLPKDTAVVMWSGGWVTSDLSLDDVFVWWEAAGRAPVRHGDWCVYTGEPPPWLCQRDAARQWSGNG